MSRAVEHAPAAALLVEAGETPTAAPSTTASGMRRGRCRNRGGRGSCSWRGRASSTSWISLDVPSRMVAMTRCARRWRSARPPSSTKSGAAGLVGRGGAAFPTGRKWQAVGARIWQPHYLVANADESEPGTFKDRVVIENDPFSIVEAMSGRPASRPAASRATLYLRRQHADCVAADRGSDRRRGTAGYLGEDILGRVFASTSRCARAPGAYICGEETALFTRSRVSR